MNRQNFLQIGPVYPTYVNRQIPLPKQAAAAGKEASESPLARAILKRRSVGWKPATVFRTVLLQCPYSVRTLGSSQRWLVFSSAEQTCPRQFRWETRSVII